MRTIMFICTICEKCQPCKGKYPIGIHGKLICKACMDKLGKYITPIKPKIEFYKDENYGN